jgi:hypothetical protein
MNGKMTLKHYKAEHTLQIQKVYKEWADMKSGKLNAKKFSNFTKLFIAAVEKAGYNVDDFIKNETPDGDNHSTDNK